MERPIRDTQEFPAVGPVPDRPGPAVAAAVLLGAAGAVATLLFLVGAGLVDDEPRTEAPPGLYLAMALVVALDVLLVWAIRQIMSGRQEGRTGLYVAGACLALPSFWAAAVALSGEYPEPGLALVFLLVAATAITAAVLLSLPSVSAYVRACARLRPPPPPPGAHGSGDE